MNTKKLTALTVTFVILIGAILSLSPISAQAADTSALPAAFPESSASIDYTDMPYSTSVKDQDDFGMCWAFAAVACAEADAIKNHGADKNSIDLSELHLAYFAYNGEREGTGDSVSLSVSTPYYDVGGFAELSMLVLASGIGFVDESIAPFDTLLNDNTATLESYLMNLCDYRISNVIRLDIASDPDAVKEAIYKYGAVAINCYTAADYVTSDGTAQYCGNTAKKADHAVTVIGWDDSYSRYNFELGRRPKSNGAWLVKNSWGEEFGHSGYYWISYEDVTLEGGAAFDIVPADTYDSIYQHDGGITTHYIPLSDGKQIEAVNIFTADKQYDELLTSVGVAVYNTSGDGAYTLKIYGEPEYSDTNGLTYERLLLTQTGNFHDGYNTIPLDRLIELRQGDVFAVSITTGAGLMVDTTVPSSSDSSNELAEDTFFYSTAYVGEGQTLYKEGSASWKDAAKDGTPWNARIKAHTVFVENRTVPHVASTPKVANIPFGQSLSETDIIAGAVLDPTTLEVIPGTWSFLNESLVPSDRELIYLIFTPDDLMTYETVIETVRVTVDAPPPAEAETEDSSAETAPKEDVTEAPNENSTDTDIGIIGGGDIAIDPDSSSRKSLLALITLALGAIGIVAIPTIGIVALVTAGALALGAAATAVVIIIVLRKKRR